MVYVKAEYVDKPTERQKSAREAFTALRREVARQLRDEELRSAWMRRFEADNEGYKMLHTYVYAKMKESPLQLPPHRGRVAWWLKMRLLRLLRLLGLLRLL